jgi:CRISPR-associated protein Cmr1
MGFLSHLGQGDLWEMTIGGTRSLCSGRDDGSGEIKMGVTKLKACFRIVTPLFMSGANPQSAELRVPSIKGVLRFWWRALALGGLDSVDGVRAKEARIFGSTKGQSSFKLRLYLSKKINRLKKNSVLKYNNNKDAVGSGARYLGYGIIEASGEASGEITRQCIEYPLEGGVLELLFRPNTPKDDIKSVEAALISMGLLGGIGSRSRKGYGSFNLTSLTRDDEAKPVFAMPSDLNGLKETILSLFGANNQYKITPYRGCPPYTAFSETTRIDIIEEGDDPLKLLNSIGEKMMDYRSYLKSKTFYDDHHLLRAAIDGKVTNHPRRVVFGLPNNYHFHDGEKPIVKPKTYDRRASPLFIHIQQLNKNQYAAITSIFPADFLPNGEKIVVGKSPVNVNVNGYKVLHEFIDGKGTPRFASPVRVI